MKVIAFNGSARKDGNTAILINHVLLQLKEEGIAGPCFHNISRLHSLHEML